MKSGLKLLLLLLLMALLCWATFSITTYVYNIDVFSNKALQLYGGLISGLGSIIAGIMLVFRPDVPVDVPVAEREAEAAALEVDEADVEGEAAGESFDSDIIPSVTETQVDLEKTMIQNIITENFVEENLPSEEFFNPNADASWPMADDTTMVLNTMEIEKASEETANEAPLAAAVSAPTVELVSPLGPKSADESDHESAEKTNEDFRQEAAMLSEESAQQASMEWPSAPMDAEQISVTQENYIQNSQSSYLSETGQPQFRITEKMPKLEIPEEEYSEDFEGYDVRYSNQDRFGAFLNGVMTVLFIVLALLIIYLAFTKLFE